jgi:hypothetical protein
MWQWIGGPKKFIRGVPADDLSDDQMDEYSQAHPRLKSCGLWKHRRPPKAAEAEQAAETPQAAEPVAPSEGGTDDGSSSI